MAARHEVAWARRTRGFDQKLTVGTDRLKAVVFDDHRFALQKAQEQGCESGTGDVYDVIRANELPELNETRVANRAERISAVVVIPRRSLCDERDFELPHAVRIAH